MLSIFCEASLLNNIQTRLRHQRCHYINFTTIPIIHPFIHSCNHMFFPLTNFVRVNNFRLAHIDTTLRDIILHLLYLFVANAIFVSSVVCDKAILRFPILVITITPIISYFVWFPFSTIRKKSYIQFSCSFIHLHMQFTSLLWFTFAELLYLKKHSNVIATSVTNGIKEHTSSAHFFFSFIMLAGSHTLPCCKSYVISHFVLVSSF